MKELIFSFDEANKQLNVLKQKEKRDTSINYFMKKIANESFFVEGSSNQKLRFNIEARKAA